MYALGAGELFNVNGHTEYIETIIGNAYYNNNRVFLIILSIVILETFRIFRLYTAMKSFETVILQSVFLAKCIDMYTQLRVKIAENPDEDVPIDERLIIVVDKMFQRCFEDKKFKQVLTLYLCDNMF